MHAISLIATLAVAAVLAVAGLVQIAGPARLLRLFVEWGYGRGFNWVSGIGALLAATFLAIPQIRAWGVALGGVMLFGSTILLLAHRKYLFALPNILLLGALPLALVAG
jgi:hypothetical protein